MDPYRTPARARARRTVAAALAGAVVLAVVALAAPAGAQTTDPGSGPAHGWRAGRKIVFPTHDAWHRAGHPDPGEPGNPVPRRAARAQGSGQLAYGGGVDGIGVTTGAPKVYVVFWGSQWQSGGDPMGMAPRLQAMFQGLGTNGETWSGVMTQYCEGVAAGATSCPAGAAHVGYPTGGALAGVWFDSAAAAPANATDHQIGVEAVNAAAHFGNTTAASNRNAQYFVVSPTGTHPGGFGPTGNFCAWHDWNGDTTLNGGAVVSNYGDIAFTNMPYVTDLGTSCGQNYVNSGSAGTLDGVTIVGGHEYAETITDQNPAGGWTDLVGYENADKCAWVGTATTVGTGGATDITFANGTFAMQGTYSNDANGCQTSHGVVGLATDDFSIAASPASVSAAQGTSTGIAVNTAVTNGSAQSVALALSGAPTGVSGSFNPASVTAGGSSTLTLTIGSAVTPGTYNLTVTGTGSTATHATGVALTVTGNDFTIGASPASVTVARGSSGSTSLSLAPTNGSTAQTVALFASGLPAGLSATFSPTSVTGAGTSTLTLAATSTATTGTFTVTVTGTGSSATHSTNVGVTVTLASGSGVVNGGFETGTLSGWTKTAGTASVAGNPHSGAYAAVVGASTATNGNSSIAQTFTAPSGSTRLAFWYAVHCPDSVQYDWATVTLRDNTSRTTRTLLGRTCTNTGAWVQVSGSLTAGHSYTLTLVSHDDNFAGDPTFTQYDDVTVQ